MLFELVTLIKGMQGYETCRSYYIEWPCHVWYFKFAEDVVKGATYELAKNNEQKNKFQMIENV